MDGFEIIDKQKLLKEQQLSFAEEQQRTTEEQQRRMQDSQYVIRKMDKAQYYEEQRNFGISNRANLLRHHVRTAIVDKLGQKHYDAFDKLMIKKEGDEPTENLTLHHSAGSKYTLNGEDVIEFNMAGSGFRYWRKDYKGMVGWEDKDEYYGRDIKVSWYNKLLFWLPKIKSKAQIEQMNADRHARNAQIEKLHGKLVTEKVAGKTLHHLRKKESVNELGATKTRFTLRGPNSINTGKYNEDNLEEYMLALGQSTLETKFAKWKDLGDDELANEKPINIIIQGHSRGAVASGLGAMRIKRWIFDNYPRFLGKVHFEVIQYDPVAGAWDNYGNNEMIDHTNYALKEKDSRYMALGEEANTTVFYSMHSNHSVAFTPQIVKNAKRLILSMADHSVNLNEADQSQKGKTTRQTYLAQKDGKIQAFRGTGISDLDKGIYMADDHYNLIRINSLEEFDAIAKPLLKGTVMQSSRHKAVRRAVKAWFEGNGQQVSDAAQSEGPIAEEPQEEIITLKTEAQKAYESEEAPREMGASVKLLQKLGDMPQETPKQRKAYTARKNKFLAARRSGLLSYIDRYARMKGSIVGKSRRQYLRDLAQLSYHLEKKMAGLSDDATESRISTLVERLKTAFGSVKPDRFVPAYLKKTLVLATEDKLKAFFDAYDGKEEPKWDTIQSIISNKNAG